MGWLVARMKQRRSSLSCSLLGGSLLLLLLLLLLQSLVLPMREREVRSSWSGQRRDTATATAAFECSLTTPNQHSAVQFQPAASHHSPLSTLDSRLSTIESRLSSLCRHGYGGSGRRASHCVVPTALNTERRC